MHSVLQKNVERETSLTEKKETNALLALLAHEIFDQAMDIDASTVDWSAVLAEAQCHKVTALMYPAIRSMDGVPEAVFNKVCGTAITVATASEAMLKEQRRILDLLEARQIPCAVLKGTSVAYLYPHPELRTIGDIDILVDEENLDEACKALQADGFAPSYTAEKHLCLQKGAVWVEMHRMVSVFPESEKGRFTKQTMADALRHTQEAEIGGVRFPMLSGAYQIIALLAHMEQHLATSGIGLRQVCDWAVTAHALRNCFDGETLALLERCGLLRFARIMTRLCERYLGLPPCPWMADASDALVDAMLSDVLEGGNFQAQHAKRPFADVLTDAYDVSGKGKTSLFRNYIRYLKKYLRQNEPWAKSRLWLPVFGVFLPVRWGVRVLLGKRKQINLVHAVGMAREREKLLRELELYR